MGEKEETKGKRKLGKKYSQYLRLMSDMDSVMVVIEW